MSWLRDTLSGYKTIITAVAGITAAIAAYATGAIELAPAAGAIWLGIVAIFQRLGSKKAEV